MAAIRNWPFFLLLAFLAVVIAACGRPRPTPYEDLLGLVPDAAETRSSVFINDYALIRKLFDIPLPGPGADKKEMEEYYNYRPPLPWKEGLPDFRGVGTTAFLSDGYSEWRFRLYELYQGLHRQHLGFDIRNEDQAMVAGAPPRVLEVLRGRFDPEAFDRALSACSGECTPPDTRERYQGMTFSSWGEDFNINLQKRLAPPAFDQFGRGGRIAVQDKYVFRTLSTDGMKALRDAGLDKRPSLADVEEYRLLTKGLSELGAYGMFLTDKTQGFEGTLEAICQGLSIGQQECVRVGEDLEKQPMLRRYQAFASGVGKDERGSYTALVLVHADEASASDNLTLLRRRIEQGTSLAGGDPWTRFFDSRTMEVSAKGRVLLAKLRPAEGRPPIWIEWVLKGDPLLLHEPKPGFVLPAAAPRAPVTPTAAQQAPLPTAPRPLAPTVAPAPVARATAAPATPVAAVPTPTQVLPTPTLAPTATARPPTPTPFPPTSVPTRAIVSIVDTLGAATPTTQFSVVGSGGVSLLSSQFVGPEFTLAQPTTLTEIGGFVNNCGSIVAGKPQCPATLPFTVQIRPSTNGVPDASNVLASFVLSHDNDPLVVSCEKVAIDLTLPAGTYFVLFTPQSSDGGLLLGTASSPFNYQAGLTKMGFLNPSTGGSSASQQFGAVRILGKQVANRP